MRGVMNGVDVSIGVDGISRRSRGWADCLLGPGRTKNGMVSAAPRGLVMMVRQFGCDARRLLRIIHRIGRGCDQESGWDLTRRRPQLGNQI
jgi:hypothetical protein